MTDYWAADIRDRASALMNQLAPVTRRDEWWATEGAMDILCQALSDAMDARSTLTKGER